MNTLKLLPPDNKNLEVVNLLENDKYIFHRSKPKQTASSKTQVTKSQSTHHPRFEDYHEDDCCDYRSDEYYEDLYKMYGYYD